MRPRREPLGCAGHVGVAQERDLHREDAVARAARSGARAPRRRRSPARAGPARATRASSGHSAREQQPARPAAAEVPHRVLADAERHLPAADEREEREQRGRTGAGRRPRRRRRRPGRATARAAARPARRRTRPACLSDGYDGSGATVGPGGSAQLDRPLVRRGAAEQDERVEVRPGLARELQERQRLEGGVDATVRSGPVDRVDVDPEPHGREAARGAKPRRGPKRAGAEPPSPARRRAGGPKRAQPTRKPAPHGTCIAAKTSGSDAASAGGGAATRLARPDGDAAPRATPRAPSAGGNAAAGRQDRAGERGDDAGGEHVGGAQAGLVAGGRLGAVLPVAPVLAGQRASGCRAARSARPSPARRRSARRRRGCARPARRPG